MITGFSCKWTHLILGIFILVSAALFQVASVAYASPVNILSVFLCVFSFISSTVGGIILTKAFETDKNFIKKLEPLLFPIIRKNHINTAQINKIVQEYKNDPQSPIGIRIGDMIPNLSSVTTDLISLSGQNLANAISSFN